MHKKKPQNLCDSMASTRTRSIGSYRYLKTIRSGSFSEVALVARKCDLYACKIVNRRSIFGIEDALQNEVSIHKMLHHPNIVELIDLYHDEENFYLISEYCPNGDLCDQLDKSGRFSEQIVKKFALQIISALDYLHKNNISHRDIKPDNLLLDSMFNIKLTDFGLSSFLGENDKVCNSCGSIQYASPECLCNNEYNGRTTDIWSLGITLYLLLTGSFPWTGRDEETITEQILNSSIKPPRFVSPLCSDFLMRLLQKDCSQRLSLDEAIHHPWFDGKSPLEIRSRFSIPTNPLLPIVPEQTKSETSTESHSTFKPGNKNCVKSNASFGISRFACDNSTSKEIDGSPNESCNRISRSLITEEKMRIFLAELKTNLQAQHQENSLDDEISKPENGKVASVIQLMPNTKWIE